MPLPFLTADRAFDGETEDVVLPFHDRQRWRRPYRPGPPRVGLAALVLLLASFVLAAAVIIAATTSVTGAWIWFGVALLMIAGALRGLRIGVWVSSAGLRHVTFFATRTTAWAQVGTLRLVQQPVRWMGLPRTVQGQALVLEARSGRGASSRADGPVVLLSTHDADFLGRPASFDRASDTVEAWADEYRTAAAGR
ncbi:MULTISPECIES: hypothetical protein [Streptomyces]|uniref:PH domain-containing protein n=1 Tax=Streptomyces chilikensis TaxID=1194079 RepID=A0ABV3EUS2_9ACTN|nr:hypothetical protein [Streptomyces sp. MJP52]MDH6224634.1 hypothetical protein [Streptomyces sp. MJP52]